MARVALGLAVCALIGCAADPTPPPRALPVSDAAAASTGPDRALELAAQLPAGADRCVVARPGRVPARRRTLIARVSQAAPLCWIAELEIEGYASAELDRPSGGSGEITLLWVRTTDRARMRKLMTERSGLALHWEGDDPACSARECPLRARFVADHVVLIERGAFVPSARSGVEAQCARMAERSPGAAELSVARSRSYGSFTFSSLPLRASSELRAHAAGLRVLRLDRMRDPIEAERVFGEGMAAGELLLPRSGPVGSNLQRTRDGANVRTEFDLPWEDLELARDDDARLQAASRQAEALLSEAPADGEAPARREDVLAELGYRLDLVYRAEGEARTREAHAVRALLEQALERDPDDEGIALLLAQLLVSELGEPAPVRVLVQRFGARPGASRGWQPIERHAAALIGADALADAFVKQGLLDRRRARIAASEIVTQLRSGVSFERAEGETLEARP